MKCLNFFRLTLILSVLSGGLLYAAKSASSYLYVGAAEGIFYATFDVRTGELGTLQPTGQVRPVSAALLPHPNGRYFYATTLVDDAEGKPVGGVSALTINASTGALTEIDRRPSGGLGPLFLSIDTAGRTLVVANASSATVTALSLDADGKFGKDSTTIKHEGESRNVKKRPQAHSIAIAPGDRYAIAADTGLDRMFIYRLDAAAARMTPSHPPVTLVAEGAGPRHIAFHPNGRFAYAINELDNTVTAFAFNRRDGSLKVLQSEPSIPADFDGVSYGADIHVHQDGKLLFASNRGHDSIAVFRIDPRSGRIKSLGQTLTTGNFPRSFSIDPSGKFLIVANERSDQLRIFRIDAKAGSLEAVGKPVSIARPICVKFFAR